MWVWCAIALAGGKIEKAAELADRAMDEPDPVVALRLAEKALKKDPNSAMGYFALGRAFDQIANLVSDADLAQKLVAASDEAMARVVALEPDSLIGSIARDALRPSVLVLPQPECSDEAIGAYVEAERSFSAGDRVAARAAYDRALAACPENPVWWVYSGDAYFPEDLPAALSRYEQGIGLAPCHWQGYRFQSDALMRMNEPERAYHAATRAVACNPTYAAGWQSAAIATEAAGGSVVVEAPPPLPMSARAAHERGPAWSAWWDYRAEHPIETLEGAVTAARAGLAAAPAADVWKVLAQAEADGALDHAVLILLFEPNLQADLQAADREALFTFVERYLFAR